MIDVINYKNSFADLLYIDLFAGIGGFRQAMDSFGAKCSFSCEIDEDCRAVYERNFGDRPAGGRSTVRGWRSPPHSRAISPAPHPLSCWWRND